MSGSPKFSEAKLAEYKQKIIEEERQRRAELETRRRQEAEERERERQLELSRSQAQRRIESILSQLKSQWHNLYQEDAATLQQRATAQQTPIAHATSETEFLPISEELLKIAQSLQTALDRKRRDEAEKKRRADIDRRQFELEELERQVANIPEAEALKFDAAGRQQLRAVLQKIRGAIAAGDPVAVRRPLTEATALVQKHRRQIARGQAAGKQLEAEANRLLAEMQAIAAGLKADRVVMQWQGAAVAELEEEIKTATVAIAQGELRRTGILPVRLKDIRQRSQNIVDTANTAQVQADKRDYIADSIAQTLQEMGFNLTFRQAEHPDHPASAIILGATSQTGKGIGVSVPIAGEVYYDVNGYAKGSTTTVEGDTVKVCDEAERVLTEMHGMLEDKYGVEMGEVLWEGKEPNRRLRQGEHLPRSQERSRSRSI
jgi:hypothetical protein